MNACAKKARFLTCQILFGIDFTGGFMGSFVPKQIRDWSDSKEAQVIYDILGTRNPVRAAEDLIRSIPGRLPIPRNIPIPAAMNQVVPQASAITGKVTSQVNNKVASISRSIFG